MNRKDRLKKLSMAFAEWNEEDHPRDDSGRFGSGGGDEKDASPKGDRALDDLKTSWLKAGRSENSTEAGNPFRFQTREQIVARGGSFIKKDLKSANPVVREMAAEHFRVEEHYQEAMTRTAIRVGDRRVVESPGLYALSNAALVDHLGNGSFTVMSAANPPGQTLNPDQNEQRMNKLKADLTARGAIFHDTIGMWEGNPEPSVLVHHLGSVSKEFLQGLGKKYEQTAVLNYSGKTAELHYTSGDQMDKNEKIGEGYKLDPKPLDPHTAVPGAGKFAFAADGQPKKWGFRIKTEDGTEQFVQLGSGK